MTATINKTISLGKPVMTPCLIPVEHKATPNCINDPFMINGECWKVTAMSFGSPHGAVFVDDVDNVMFGTQARLWVRTACFQRVQA